MKKLSVIAFAAAALFAGSALAGPPPWAGGPGGNPGNSSPEGNGSFENWAGGSVMSGSANSFEFNGRFNELGGSLGGVSADAWQQGNASVNAAFDGSTFNGTVRSEHFGDLNGIGGGLGGGEAHRFDYSAGSFGQSFGELEWGMNASEFSSW